MADDQRWPVRRLPVALRERYLAQGWRSDDTIGGLVDRSLRAVSDATVHIWSESRPSHDTYAEIRADALRLVTALAEEGLEVAVVAAPDERLGEHVCAVVRLAPEAAAIELREIPSTSNGSDLPGRNGPRSCAWWRTSRAPRRARSARWISVGSCARVRSESAARMTYPFAAR